MKKAFVNIKYNLVDADGNMHLTIGSLIEINSITTGSNNISSRKVNVKPYRFNKMYMDKDLIYYKLYQIVDQFSERKTTTLKLCSTIHRFSDRNGMMGREDILR